jgi:hypothetical protein
LPAEIAYASTFSQTAARVAVGGVVLALLCLTFLHVVRPDLDPSRRMISEYALGANGWLMTLCFASYAVAGVGLAVALLASPARDRGLLFWIGLLFLIAAAAGPALASVFPTDPASTPPQLMTHSGKMHGLSFMIGVPGELFAMLLLTLLLHHRALWLPGNLLIALTSVAWVSVIVLAAAMFLTIGQHRTDPGIVGSANRVFMIAYGLWVAVAAWPLAAWSSAA